MFVVGSTAAALEAHAGSVVPITTIAPAPVETVLVYRTAIDTCGHMKHVAVAKLDLQVAPSTGAPRLPSPFSENSSGRGLYPRIVKEQVGAVLRLRRLDLQAVAEGRPGVSSLRSPAHCVRALGGDFSLPR